MKKIIATSAVAGTFLSLTSPVFAAITISIPPPRNLRILDFGKLFSALIGIVLILAGVAAFAYLLWGGFEWIISGGDKGKVEAAQHRIQAALVGLFIVFATWAFFSLIEKFLGISILGGFVLPTPFD